MVRCICGNEIDMNTYGFYKCESCQRVYALGENGMSYQGYDYTTYKIEGKQIDQTIIKGLNALDIEWLFRLVLDCTERLGSDEHQVKIAEALEKALHPTILC